MLRRPEPILPMRFDPVGLIHPALELGGAIDYLGVS
jgi:hypothetical protein